MTSRPGRSPAGHQRSGPYLVVTAVALVLTVYLALQVTGFVFRLVFIGAAAAVGLAAWRAWRAGP